MIEGRIQYREYTGQDGVKKTACDIRCDNFVMLGRMDDGGGSRDSGGYGGKATGGGSQDFEDHGAPSPMGASNSFPDDDIPF
jgi:single-stranded DNA-binding protein